MVCYAVPLAGAVLCHVFRTRFHAKDAKLFWLNLMLFGGALFGIVDHLWNGELFLIGNNIWGDLALGVAITLAITVSWALVAYSSKAEQKQEMPS